MSMIMERGSIVIADDDPEIRSMLKAIFKRALYAVRAYKNGELAIAAVRLDPPDIIILDWMMPVMDGRTAVEILRGDPATCRIPIVMLTGQATIDECVLALKAGVQDFLIKPCHPRELVARIEAQIRWRELLEA